MVKIDVRKLISFGKGSFIISMPKYWIEKNHLKKGDLISLDDGGSELVITASTEEKKLDSKEIDINASKKEIGLLKAEIVSSYLNGYDTLNIHFESGNRDIARIKDIIRNLSGMEIMEQTSTRIVAKNLININEISLNNIIRRMDVITRAMLQDAISCIGDASIYESINNRDVDVNRLYYLGYRAIKNAIKNPRIAKSFGIDVWKLHSDSYIIKKIERIADMQKRIARFLMHAGLDKKAITELENIYAEISESYNDLMKAYYTNDKEIAYRIETTNKKKTELCDQFLENYTMASTKAKMTHSKLIAVAKIVENLKGTAVDIRDMARTVLCYE